MIHEILNCFHFNDQKSTANIQNAPNRNNCDYKLECISDFSNPPEVVGIINQGNDSNNKYSNNEWYATVSHCNRIWCISTISSQASLHFRSDFRLIVWTLDSDPKQMPSIFRMIQWRKLYGWQRHELRNTLQQIQSHKRLNIHAGFSNQMATFKTLGYTILRYETWIRKKRCPSENLLHWPINRLIRDIVIDSNWLICGCNPKNYWLKVF